MHRSTVQDQAGYLISSLCKSLYPCEEDCGEDASAPLHVRYVEGHSFVVMWLSV